jgi:hypothetical protein
MFQFYKIFHSRRAGNMADQVVDLKKWEAAIFSGNANQSEEAYKILKDYISDKKPGNRKVMYFSICITFALQWSHTAF